jgi:hypothetical protein
MKPSRAGSVSGGRLWPRRDYYGELFRAASEGHPIDLLLDRTPAIRRLRRQVLRLQRDVATHMIDKAKWVRYADARVALQSLREEFSFNLGVELGAVTVRSEGTRQQDRSTAQAAEERSFRLAVRDLLFEGDLAAERRLVVLIEMAWALAMGSPAVMSFRSSGPPRSPRARGRQEP